MIHLLLETFGLVTIAFGAGLLCGFAARRLHIAMRGGGVAAQTKQSGLKLEPAGDETDVQPTTRTKVRRIPDPAPPSEIRRRRLADNLTSVVRPGQGG